MDNISNYFNIAPSINEANEEQKEHIASIKEEALAKIKSYTDPIGEGFLIESAKNTLKDGLLTGLRASVGAVKNTAMYGHLKAMGFNEDDAGNYVKAFRKGGFKGVLNNLREDFNSGKFSTALEGATKPSLELQEAPEQVEKITDLPLHVFQATENGIKAGLAEKYKGLSTEGQKKVFRKFNDIEKVERGDQMPVNSEEDVARRQGNFQKFSDLIDEQQKVDSAGQSLLRNTNINLSNVEFNDENDLMNVRSRLTQSFNNVEENLTRPNLRGEEAFNKLQSLRQSVQEQVEGTAEELKDSAEGSVKKALGKAFTKAGEVDLEEGGPDDIVGDVASVATGLSVFLGGRLHKASNNFLPNVSEQNLSYQIGA
tara:strand:+ start:3502 stop:4611 length:1110 start_codon:yes stop_codon:yes gene_type:complete